MTSIDQRLTAVVQNAIQLAHQLEDLYSLREQVKNAKLKLRQRPQRPRSSARTRSTYQIRALSIRSRAR